MDKKKFSLISLIATALVFVLTILETLVFDTHSEWLSEFAFGSLRFGTQFFSIITPLLFITAFVCGYFVFKEDTSFSSKWVWVVLALLFADALSSVLDIPVYLFQANKIQILPILSTVLYAAGIIGLLLSILHKNFRKIMPFAFGPLALTAILSLIRIGFSIHRIALILAYALLAVMALGLFPKFGKLFRALAIAFVLIGTTQSLSAFFTGIALIILAILLVPGWKPFKITASRLVAALCAITMLLSIGSVLSAGVFEDVQPISNIIKYAKETIATLPDVEAKLAEKETEKSELETELETQRKTLKNAETSLDSVCANNYFSRWYCETDLCKPLHNAVENIGDKIAQTEGNISTCKDRIQDIKSEIDHIHYLEEQLPIMRTNLVEALVTAIITTLTAILAFAALALLAFSLFKGAYGKLAILSCAGLGAASLFYMLLTTPSQSIYSFDLFNYPIFRFLASPYLWGLATVALLTLLFAGKTKNPAKVRTFTMLTAIVMVGVTAIAAFVDYEVFRHGESTFVVFVLYALALTFTAFILAPAVFPEYIGIGKHILLSLITLGIWNLLWIYNVTKNLNKASCDSRKPFAELLLCMFLPFYFIYWVYKTAEIAAAYGAEHGQQFKLDIVCLAFTFVCPIVPTVLIQDKINKIVGKPE